MRIRIDLKILIFLVLFYFTNQIKIYLIIIFFCIIHELGHLIMGLILRMKPEKIEIMPCGLAISFKTDVEDINIELKKIIVAIAGPLLSFILILLYTYIEPIYLTREDAIYSNILIMLFNLIPIYPLDGGRIIKGILHIKLGREQTEIIIRRISNITMILFTIISSIGVFYLKNIAIFLICIFLWIITLQENKKWL